MAVGPLKSNLLDMRSLGELSSNTRVLTSGMFEPKHTQREGCVTKTEERHASVSQEKRPQTQKKKNHNFTTFILDFNLQNCKKTNFYSSTPHPHCSTLL